MIRFVAAMESENIDLKTLGYHNVRVPEVLSGLKKNVRIAGLNYIQA